MLQKSVNSSKKKKKKEVVVVSRPAKEGSHQGAAKGDNVALNKEPCINFTELEKLLAQSLDLNAFLLNLRQQYQNFLGTLAFINKQIDVLAKTQGFLHEAIKKMIFSQKNKN